MQKSYAKIFKSKILRITFTKQNYVKKVTQKLLCDAVEQSCNDVMAFERSDTGDLALF